MLKRSTLSALSLRVSMCLLATAVTLPALGEEGPEADRDHPAERAEWNAMLRRDRNGRILSENRLKALDAMCQIPVDPSMAQAPAGSFTRSAVGPSVRSSYTFSGTSWQPLGPQPTQSRVTAHQNFGVVSGRIDAIAIHPTNANIMLLGGATGGIWKSTDGGASWRPVADTAPALAISHISFSPANPSIVFAATGEVDKGTYDTTPAGSLGTYLGSGLLKSVDSGDTWVRIDSTLPANAILSRVLPHPSNTQVVVVGVYRYFDSSVNTIYVGGLYRSTDGGVTFTRTLTHEVSDLAQDPNIADRLYLATGGCSNCGPSGVYGSVDFGQSWTPVWGVSAGTSIGNTKIGISRTNPAVVYASFLNPDWSHSGIYRSVDAGVTWTTIAFEPTMCPTSGNGNNQCYYDHWISPDPYNPLTVYFGSIDLYKSTDGGTTWSNILNVYASSGPTATTHPDQHTATFSPTGRLFLGNDGGIYRSDNGGGSFQSLNSTLTLAQFNGVALHPTNTAFAMGGTQDNGNQRYTGSSLWTDQTGGDGGFSLIRRDSPVQILSGYAYQGMNYSGDGGQSFSFFSDCKNGSGGTSIACADLVAFYPPAVSPAGQPSTVLLGTSRIWSNSAFGQNPLAWSARSSAKVTNSFFTTLDAPGGDPGPVWGGTLTGSIFFSSDGGATFVTRFSGLPAAPVTRIVSVTADGRSAYATFAGYLGLPSQHVFRTTDAGVTWTNISNNLPDVPVLDIKVDPTDPTDIFLGSDVGVFRSTNGGATWTTFNAGLPNVPVYGLAFHPVTNDLWAATYGRGVWRVTNPASAVLAANFSFSPPIPSAGQVVTFTDRSTGSPTSWSWNFGDGSGGSTAQNPSHSFFGAGTYQVALTVANSGGSNAMTQAVIVNRGAAAGCIADAYTMCFGNGRYRVTSSWQNQYVGDKIPTSLRKTAFTDIVGSFWIDVGAYQYFVSVNPATSALNGYTWVAINTFSGVEFWIDVMDTVSGLHKTYHNPPENKTLVEDRTFFVYP